MPPAARSAGSEDVLSPSKLGRLARTLARLSVDLGRSDSPGRVLGNARRADGAARTAPASPVLRCYEVDRGGACEAPQRPGGRIEDRRAVRSPQEDEKRRSDGPVRPSAACGGWWTPEGARNAAGSPGGPVSGFGGRKPTGRRQEAPGRLRRARRPAIAGAPQAAQEGSEAALGPGRPRTAPGRRLDGSGGQEATLSPIGGCGAALDAPGRRLGHAGRPGGRRSREPDQEARRPAIERARPGGRVIAP